MGEPFSCQIEAFDGYPLTADIFPGGEQLVVISGATAVPRQFYRHLARYLQEWGATVVTFDYRGVGDSRPESLRGFQAQFSEWGSLDLKGVLRWTYAEKGRPAFVVGHSAGGQVAALAEEPIAAMVAVSSQSGYWGLQGGLQKLAVLFHMTFTFPVLSHLFGYMPWSLVGNAEDIPKGVALQWARWCRHRDYLFSDKSLPLHLYQDFQAPILAYSIHDDDWGTAKSVDSMMGHYPNVQRRHLEGPRKLGHFGFFKRESQELWGEVTEFFEEASLLREEKTSPG